jgi:hypothetical protein
LYSLKAKYAGLSKPHVQKILNQDKQHYRHNAKFLNKATLKPIRARDVHIRHQIDLLNLAKGGRVSFKGITYR